MNLRALLKQVPATAYLYGLLVVGLAGASAGFVHYQREIGRREVQLVQSEALRRQAVMRYDSLEKAYRPQTASVVKWKTKWDSTKAGVDTQWLKPDSVPVPVEVVRYITATADSTIKACTRALATCDQMVGAQRARAEAAEQEVRILKRSMPGKLARCGVGVGAAVVWDGQTVRTGPGVSVACKVFP